VHHVAWLRRLPVRWLSHVVVHETIHPRHAVRVKTVDLHGHVFEQLAGIRIGNRRFLGRQRFRVPDRNLLHATVVAVPGIALVAPQSVKVTAVAVEPAKHAVEGSVLQHENDDVFDPCHAVMQRRSWLLVATRVIRLGTPDGAFPCGRPAPPLPQVR
jgi:hypothetical protein